jgi:glycosyltransferase involved in cell wall biosynthesis
MQVEQEPGSLALTQFVLASTWQRAKLIAFTWENLFYRQPGVRHHLERLALARLDYLLAGSTTTAQVFQRKGYKGPMKVLPNVGIDSEHFAPRPQPDLRQSLGLGDRFVVGFAGRLVPEKGCEDLMRAFAELPDCCHLLMVGGGRERERLSQLAHSLDIAQRVTFQPTVPHREVPRYLNCMDCLVLSSHTTPIWAEQFGLILAQAMACGVPVVGSDCGAIPEVISDAGLIFPEGDVEALRTNLLQLQTDPALRTALSARGRARVEAHYTHQRIAEQTFALYQQVMSSRR